MVFARPTNKTVDIVVDPKPTPGTEASTGGNDGGVNADGQGGRSAARNPAWDSDPSGQQESQA